MFKISLLKKISLKVLQRSPFSPGPPPPSTHPPHHYGLCPRAMHVCTQILWLISTHPSTPTPPHAHLGEFNLQKHYQSKIALPCFNAASGFGAESLVISWTSFLGTEVLYYFFNFKGKNTKIQQKLMKSLITHHRKLLTIWGY